MKYSILLFFELLFSSVFGQVNMNLIGHIDYQALHGAQLNDIWGYVDETGIEYALVGTTKGTSVVSLADPVNPVEVFWQPGLESIWRDLCVWGDYAYITTEANNGLLIIDMSPLPQSNALTTTLYFGDNFPWLETAHTLYIDESGYCYVFGSNVGNGGAQIYDVHTDPMNPSFVGSFDNWYVHDGFVRGDTMYLAHIYEGFFSLVDISDKQNPVLLGTKSTPGSFTHNIWPSDNSQFVFTTDEVSGGYVGAYDISNPTNIIEVDRVQSSPGANVVPHNVHFLNNFLVTSNYSDGIVVHDATHPNNLIEVANYDTYPTQTTGYDGCWGAYPFLPSGVVLATDRTSGFFVLGVDYQQAAYLEGNATDASTSNPLQDVEVTITGTNFSNSSLLNGDYATGIATGGLKEVTYHKVGYFPLTENVNLTQGVVTVNDVQLTAIPPYTILVTVLDAATSNPIPNAFVRFDGEFLSHEGTTNGIGEEDLTLYYEEDYLVTVGVWGYVTECSTMSIDVSTGAVTIQLEKGYYDDFSFDFGWVTGGDATEGQWQRGIPFGTEENANPGFDATGDCGNHAYVTGNTPNFILSADEVDNGSVVLFSPIMDLTSYTTPHVNYDRWFYNKYGAQAVDDSLRISLSNGTQTVVIEVLGGDVFNNEWNVSSFQVSDFLTVTSTMQIIIQTSDYNQNIVEAGFDHFFVSENNMSSVGELVASVNVSIYPNPFDASIILKNGTIGESFSIYNLEGKLIQEGMIQSAEQSISTSHLENGMYIFKTSNEVRRIVKN